MVESMKTRGDCSLAKEMWIHSGVMMRVPNIMNNTAISEETSPNPWVYGISISASIAYEIYSNSYRFEHLYPFQKHTLIWLIMTSPYNRGGGSGWGSMRANMRHILNLYGNKSQS